jgi:hypothetical protein
MEVVRMDGRGASPAADGSLAAILSRNLNAKVPKSLRAMLQPDERALVVLPSRFGAIVATDRRVLLERISSPNVEYDYKQLTGAVARIGVFSRTVVLIGPGLPEKVGFGLSGTSSNSTIIQLWQVGRARRAAAEISELVAAANLEQLR